MSKHTPGNWTAHGHQVRSEPVVLDGKLIATCVESSKESSEQQEAEANARLIAAAPEMLEALNKLENQLCHGVVDNPKERANCPANWLHALVAKAEGRPNW